MLLQPDPTPAEVRERVREIFERAEFQRTKPWIERVLDWIAERLSFGGAGGWGGSIGSIVTWVVLVLLVVGLGLVIYFVVRNHSPRVKQEKPKTAELEIEELRTASEWATDADRLEAQGDWKEAIRCRYRELVARLVDAGVAPPLAGRTTGELRSDIAEKAPDVSGEFSRATGLFEMPWYADAPTGPTENAEFKGLASRVLEEVG